MGVEHDLDHIRREDLRVVGDRMRRRRQGTFRVLGQMRRYRVHQTRIDEWLVALHIDDDRVVGPPLLDGHLGETIGASRVIRTRQGDIEAVRGDGIGHTL